MGQPTSAEHHCLILLKGLGPRWQQIFLVGGHVGGEFGGLPGDMQRVDGIDVWPVHPVFTGDGVAAVDRHRLHRIVINREQDAVGEGIAVPAAKDFTLTLADLDRGHLQFDAALRLRNSCRHSKGKKRQPLATLRHPDATHILLVDGVGEIDRHHSLAAFALIFARSVLGLHAQHGPGVGSVLPHDRGRSPRCHAASACVAA